MLNEDIIEIFQGFAKDKKASGVYLAQPTGEVLEEDATYIEVILYGKSVYAKPCMAFGSYNVPDAEWLKKYKEEISVWVAFENGNPAHPVYLGVAPRDGKAPEGNFPEIKSFKTAEFSCSYNDPEKVFKLAKIDGQNQETHKIEITENSLLLSDTKNNLLEFDFETGVFKARNSKKSGIDIGELVDLGKGGSTHSALLGEEVLNKITALILELSSALSSISKGIIIVNPTTMTGVFDPATISTLATNIANLTQLQAQLITSLSKNVRLD